MNYDNLKIPNHVAIIVDGNGRWAKERGMSRSKGHDAGYQNLKKLCEYMFNKGVKFFSAYCFSTENFKRSEEEVNHLMDLFVKGFKKEKNIFVEKDIKVVFSGRKKPLRDDVLSGMDEITNLTKDCKNGVLNICINYGGQAEIIDAVNKAIASGKKSITEEDFKEFLYQNLPPIDLMIRTSGEVRISNFMLWQLAYAELYFPKTYFPDFDEACFDEAILEYNKRDRRFGGIDYTKK